MTFIFSIIIGLIFGISNLTVLISIISILFLTSLRSTKDILFSKDFITGTESAYKIYLHNLELSNKNKNYARIKYILQLNKLRFSVPVILPLPEETLKYQQ